jgi:hypothetical protein
MSIAAAAAAIPKMSQLYLRATDLNSRNCKRASVLTEEDCEQLFLCDHLEEEVAVNVLDRVLLHLV